MIFAGGLAAGSQYRLVIIRNGDMQKKSSLGKWRKKLLGKKSKKPPRIFEPVSYDGNTDESGLRKAKILNAIGYAKMGEVSYSAYKYPGGYHTIEIDGEVFEGQRKPAERLAQIDYDFAGKTVLDIGCNQGGIVFETARVARWAVGIDYDSRMINVCNLIRRQLKRDNTDFYVFDLDRDPFSLIVDFLPETRVNCIFLLSVCKWIDRWQELITFCAQISDCMVFETNGSAGQQQAQVDFLNRTYESVELVADQSLDDSDQANRMLFFCK